MTSRRRSLVEGRYGVPLALALATVVGLPAALVGEGLWDVASWLALSLPLAALAAKLRKR